MRQNNFSFFLILLALLMITQKIHAQIEEIMKEKFSQFTPTTISYDSELLDERQKKVVENLYYASKIIDSLFLKQVYSKNEMLRKELENAQIPGSDLLLEYFKIMFGPFDRLDQQRPFYGTEKKPQGANFYPEDMTKDEFNRWLATHPQDKEAFMSEFTVIRRQEDKLIAIPYSQYYRSDLENAAQYLRIAAEYADNPTLRKYLLLRADAFLTNDYYESDIAWMDDELFNYKAAYESFITLVDPVESQKLRIFSSLLDDIEKSLPIPDEYKNFSRGSESPIIVVQEVFSAGDTKAGVQTLAFNLPNDERVRKVKGSKKVMLKNIHEAKFNKLLLPIAEQVLDPIQLKDVTFDAFFNHTLMHEISHGVGPGFISVDGRETEVKRELKETYSKMEECKADILGIYNDIFMIHKGVHEQLSEKQVYATFLAGIFRSIRFGIDSAHGAGNAIIYNYLIEKGGYEFDTEKKQVRVNYDTIYEHVKNLARDILTIQAKGDYNGALAMIKAYAVNSPTLISLREKLQSLPVDIRPVFQIEKELSEK